MFYEQNSKAHLKLKSRSTLEASSDGTIIDFKSFGFF